MSKITVEIETPNRKGKGKGKRSGKRVRTTTTSKAKTRTTCPPTPKKKPSRRRAPVNTQSRVSKSVKVTKKSVRRKKHVAKTTPRQSPAPRQAPAPRRAPRRTTTGGGFFKSLRSFFTPRPSSLFRIKQPPYTTTPVERLDDGPKVAGNHAPGLSDQTIRIGGSNTLSKKLTGARVIRVNGEGYRLATGSPVFLRQGSIYIYGHIEDATYDGSGSYTYDVAVGRGTLKNISEDDVTPIDDTKALSLSDGPTSKTPAPNQEHAKIVHAMNKKFKLLKTVIEQIEGQAMFFVAYCGGKYGYMVRRFVLASCPTAGAFEAYRPVGMGPKGLDVYFQKRYGMSWTSFLEMPTVEVRSRLEKILASRKSAKQDATKKAEVKRTKATAKKTKRRTSKNTPAPRAISPPVKRTTPAVKKATPAAKNTAHIAASPTRASTPKRKSTTMPKAPVTKAPPRSRPAAKPVTVKQSSKADSNLDAADEGMKRLEALLSKAIS